jgi:transcriptional regulator GlxA family with amidase domain
MESHFAANLSLEQLAGVACVSPFHFHRVFLSHMGVSPHEYLIQFRLRKAREFLRNGLSITDTALDTGFVDQSHFTRFFKRAVGIAPGDYARLLCGELLPGTTLPVS